MSSWIDELSSIERARWEAMDKTERKFWEETVPPADRKALLASELRAEAMFGDHPNEVRRELGKKNADDSQNGPRSAVVTVVAVLAILTIVIGFGVDSSPAAPDYAKFMVFPEQKWFCRAYDVEVGRTDEAEILEHCGGVLSEDVRDAFASRWASLATNSLHLIS
jgi:hypothetical protein